MLKKRIIPCLDVANGRTVKGVNFVDLRDAGDPVVLSRAYSDQGADELVLLDITATVEKRGTMLDIVERVAETVSIPFTVGGGITSPEQAEALLRRGADKISVNSAAVRSPRLVYDLAREFGSQCIVVAIDAKRIDNEYRVTTRGGRKVTELRVMEWGKTIEDLGAGEILLTSMDHDGAKTGFALELTRQVSEAVRIPVISSGGAGAKAHFTYIFGQGKADAALAASIFHFGEISILDLKKYLRQQDIPIR